MGRATLGGGSFSPQLALRLARGGLLAMAVVTTACGRPQYIVSSPADLAGRQHPEGITRAVLLVSIDGLRPDAISAFETPLLSRLMREGSYSLSATTITPSKTLPSHTSMLTGEPPERHQVLWNNVTSAKRDEIELPNVFTEARYHGYRTAAFFSKAKFGPLQRPGSLDYSQAPGGWFGRWSGDRTMTDVETYLDRAVPNLLFVHLADPDAAGHRAGWMSPTYGRAVTSADRAVGRLVSAADRVYGTGGYTLIVTADHGGHGRDHGSHDPRDVTIPWIAWGKGVRPGQVVSTSIQTMDTASTVLWLLGVREPSAWAGTAVTEAFHQPARDD